MPICVISDILTPPSSPPCHERQFFVEGSQLFLRLAGAYRDNDCLSTSLIPIANFRMAQFVPRGTFPHYGAIPRSYFLGHHRAGLTKMKNMLSSIDYVVECRDSRAPVTSINPMFEEALGNKRRLVVYTKRDLSSIPQSPAQKLVSRIA
jgi:Predicted GTPases